MPIAVVEPSRCCIASPWLRRAFVFAVIAFAWLRFSDNRADNDLWGHVLYGERMLALGHVEKTDTLSWTAAGLPWINHEIGAEVVLALAHRVAGGFGLWLLMIVMAAVTVGWACFAGTRGRAHAATTLALLAVSTNFIASGYAPRPQLFTMLAMVALIVVLRRFFSGGIENRSDGAPGGSFRRTAGETVADGSESRPYLALGRASSSDAPTGRRISEPWTATSRRGLVSLRVWMLPILFAVWVNFHGGFLAGWLIVVVALGVEVMTTRYSKGVRVSPALEPPHQTGWSLLSRAGLPRDGHGGTVLAITLVIGCTAALGLNPDGFRLVTWTLESVRLPRPTITEWQPMAVGFATLPFYAVLVASALAWSFTTRRREAWAAVTLLVLGGMSVLQQRHAPLFGLANLILTPEHLESALQRVAAHFAGLTGLVRRRAMQVVVVFMLVAGGVGSVAASVARPREHPFTIEVPRDLYPVAAIAFIREHQLTGNTLTFFDWGEEVLWELPGNPVSFDGRLDTVYPRAVMNAHWRFYAGEPPGNGLELAKADVALLPAGSGGGALLVRAGWRLVYRDPLADVLVRAVTDFPSLRGLHMPFTDGPRAIAGRARFPDESPRRSLAGP